MSVEIESHFDVVKGRPRYVLTITDMLMRMLPQAIMHEIASRVAEQFVKEHYIEIAKHIDQQAIANLALAESAKQVCEAQIKAQPPTVIHEKDTQIWQRGIFGGNTRIR